MKVFVGMLKTASLFLMGEVIEDADAKDILALKNVVRVFEAQDPRSNRVVFQFMPDPYFLSEDKSYVRLSDFLVHQIVGGDGAPSKTVAEYQKFMTHHRMGQSGLVPGNVNPQEAKKIIGV